MRKRCVMIYGNSNPAEEIPMQIRFEGEPQKPDQAGEQNLWQRFKCAIKSLERGRLGFRVGTEGITLDAEIERKDDPDPRIEAKAAKFARETAKIQAKLDQGPVSQAIIVNRELRDIFSDDKTPDEVKMLELLRLLVVF